MLEENNFETNEEQLESTEEILEEEFEEEFEEDDSSQTGDLFEQENRYQKILVKHQTKKSIRRVALATGLAMLCLSAISYIYSFSYIIISIIISIVSNASAMSILDNPALIQVLQIVLSSSMFIIPFSLAVKCLGQRVDQTIHFEKAKKGTAIPFFFIGVGFCAFSNIAMSYATSIFEHFGVDYTVDTGDAPQGVFGFLLSFIATAIVPALAEEFACRGVIIGLLKKYGSAFAIICSSVVFGIMHGNFDQIPFAILVGLILGYIYVKTESIWISMAVHFVNNAISVIFTYLNGIVSSNMQNLLYVVYLIFAMLLAVVGVFMFARREDETFELEDPKDEVIAPKQKYTWFFTSWAIIIFIIVNFIEAITYFFV